MKARVRCRHAWFPPKCAPPYPLCEPLPLPPPSLLQTPPPTFTSQVVASKSCCGFRLGFRLGFRHAKAAAVSCGWKLPSLCRQPKDFNSDDVELSTLPMSTPPPSPLPMTAEAMDTGEGAMSYASAESMDTGEGAASYAPVGVVQGVCTGWRPQPVQHWTDAVGDLSMYELGIGGVLKAEDYYNATVRPHLAKPRTSYEKFCQDNPSGKQQCEANALKLQHDLGGLYMGMVDCVRAVLCDRGGGVEAHRGMCAACRALELNQAFRKRVGRHASKAAGGTSNDTRNDFLTRDELLGKNDARAEQLRVSRQQAERVRLAADTRAQGLGERAERAVAEASAMVHELCAFAVQATEAERATAEAQVEAAAAAQLAAERQVEA